MKKIISTFILVTMMAVSIPMLAGTASAQRRDGYRRTNSSRYYGQSYNYNQPTTYDKHRKAINIGVATGVGAIIGALVGGKKGALIGGAAGLAGGAIITAKQKPRNPYNRNYYRRY